MAHTDLNIQIPMQSSNTQNPPNTQLEGPVFEDVVHEMVCVHSIITGIDHEITLPTVTEQPTHCHNNDKDLAIADVNHMISRKSLELQASSTS